MTLLNRLQQTQPTRLHKDSDRRLEEFKGEQFTGVLLFNDNIHAPSINVTYQDEHGYASYDFHKVNEPFSTPFMWECCKTEYGREPENIEFSMSDMQEALESLKKLGIQNSPLMQRAICGIAVQCERGIRVGEPLMQAALRRAGLSVSDDGNISRRGVIQSQNQGERG